MLHRPGLVERIAERLDSGKFRDARHAQIFRAVIQSSGQFTAESLASELPEHSVELMQQLLMENRGLDRVDDVLEGSILHLVERDVREQLDELEAQLPYAGDEEKNEIVGRIRSLSGSIRGGRRWKFLSKSKGGVVEY